MAPDLKKNLDENYMAPNPANFLNQLPQKESGKKLYGSRSRQLSHQLPQKESS
jgi:hypothetical protein